MPSCRIVLQRALLIVGLAMACPLAFSQASASPQDQDLQKVRELLAIPEAELDLAKANLSIDQLIDPGIDIPGSLRQLDAMAAQVRTMIPVGASKHDMIVALQTYLYLPGPWNQQHPFKYNLEDPYGHDIRNKLLPTYLATGKGNCVSMPLLFIVLGQKLGLDTTAAEAPEHVLVKFRDEHGQTFNIEATSGGFRSDQGYIHDELPISAQALANGIYLRRLSKRETVIVMAHTLLEYYGLQDEEERRIALASLLLANNPKDVAAMLQEGAAYAKILKNRYGVNASARTVPAPALLDYENLERNNHLWFERAEALGWQPPTAQQNANYERRIDRAKASH
jgi:regulator of sirC expression with transglutaminase-like and TPR domain